MNWPLEIAFLGVVLATPLYILLACDAIQRTAERQNALLEARLTKHAALDRRLQADRRSAPR